MPLILVGFQAGWARILRIPRSIGADLQRLITTWGKTLQFPEEEVSGLRTEPKHYERLSEIMSSEQDVFKGEKRCPVRIVTILTRNPASKRRNVALLPSPVLPANVPRMSEQVVHAMMYTLRLRSCFSWFSGGYATH
jgi:hypothetical protein